MATKARAQHHQKQQQHQQQQHSHKSQDFKKAKSLKRKREQDELQKLRDGVDEFDVKFRPEKFSQLPISQETLAGLEASHFESLTDIQARAIPLALKGRDVLAAAKTGSGKTLAFLIPVLERLYRDQFTEYDGLGALVIAPTRELAIQIFEVLRKIGRRHLFSAGLVIGGKSLKEEAERLGRMNILVCTPGRILQHLDQTSGINVDNLRMLVLDEADRTMDMGFQSAMDAIVEHLPQRQTMLFSATQSKKVSDLARLSLQDPEYVSVHEAAAAATPSTLSQHYLVTPLPDKLNTLYGFIKSNLKSKMIVFLSSGKQVRFAYESLRHLQPGIQLLHLHGRQKQVARLEITTRFAAAKHACLFATDVVARGVDFPAVDWICQVDCPEDVDTYIHRVGRTARYDKNGKAVIFLDPSEEEAMLKKLEHRKVPIQKVNIKEKKRKSVQDQIQDMCFKDPNLKYLAQKAFTSYVRSVHLQRDKEVFNLDRLDLDGYAASLGLPGTPQIRFQKGEDAKRLKNAPRAALSSDSESEFDVDGNPKPGRRKKKKGEVRTKYDRMFERVNQDVLTSHYHKMVADGGDNAGAGNDEDDDDDDFLSVKRVIQTDDLDDAAAEGEAFAGGGGDSLAVGTKIIKHLGGDQPLVVDSKRREKLLKSKKALLRFRGRGEKVVFDDEGEAHHPYRIRDEADFRAAGDAEQQRRAFVEDEAARVRDADVDDKQAARDRLREKRERRKAREREMLEAESGGGRARPMLGPGAGGDDDGEDPLALLKSLPIADDGESDGRQETGRPRKKAKKWFEGSDDEDGDGPSSKVSKNDKDKKRKGGRKVIEVAGEPDTLEDLEALAAGLLED